MERKTKQSTETTSILSFSQRSTIVWLLGKLSLLLGVALLVVIGLFALDVGTGPRQDVLQVSEASETIQPSRLPVHENAVQSIRRGDLVSLYPKGTPTGAPDHPVLQYEASPQAAGEDKAAPTETHLQAARELPGLKYSAPSPAAKIQLSDPSAEVAADAEAVASTQAGASTAATVEGPALATKVATPTPTPTRNPQARPVQIRIPAIKVKRSIIGVPQIRDKKTGSWTQDLDVLFRKGRKDLVGYYEQSAQPGQDGNTILVGHNYGYGTKGVFLKLKRLKPGKRIEVINAAGHTFAYQVKSVHKVPWKSKGTDELLQHARLLALSGSERLTLVTCGGSKVQPFPARIYVVAEPIRD
jgi:LPXTG-site transpeptidase (sortase) family protein